MTESAADLDAIRAEFPQLATCVYLNSNSTGLVPRGGRAVLDEWWAILSGWRDEHWEILWKELHAYLDAVAAFLGAPPGSVVSDANLSNLLGRVATCFDYRPERSRVVIGGLDFPTVEFLFRAFRRYGAEPVVVQAADGNSIAEEDLCAAIDERTALVVVSHATFETGALLDAARVARHAHRHGALVALDAYQTVGVLPVDAGALDVDFILAGAHKWMCGAPDLGFLYVKPALLDSLEPAVTGWMAGEDPLTFVSQERFASTARRFASGTPAVLPALFSRVGLDLLQSVGTEAIRARSLALTAPLLAVADDLGLKIATPREDHRRAGSLCFEFEGSAEVCEKLGRNNVITSHRKGLRVAPHVYNTPDDIGAFCDALSKAVWEQRR